MQLEIQVGDGGMAALICQLSCPGVGLFVSTMLDGRGENYLVIHIAMIKIRLGHGLGFSVYLHQKDLFHAFKKQRL